MQRDNRTARWLRCGAIQVHTQGPFAITCVKLADDPICKSVHWAQQARMQRWLTFRMRLFRWVDGSNCDFPVDINDDGTLDTPYGPEEEGRLSADHQALGFNPLWAEFRLFLRQVKRTSSFA